jgi:two-component system, OmpR family, sensor histidine kinase KdpD
MKLAHSSQPSMAPAAGITTNPEASSIDVEDGAYGTDSGSPPAPDTREHVLVAVAPDEYPDEAEQLLRAAHRFAQALSAEWTMVCVETPTFLGTSRSTQDSTIELSRLVESLGATTVTLVAASPVDALLEYSRLHGARTILLGTARRRSRSRFPRNSMAAELLRRGVNADVIVIARERDDAADGRDGVRANGPLVSELAAYAAALGLTGLCTVVALPMLNRLDLIDMVMVYMLGATLAAMRLGLGPAVLTSLANIAAFDFFFVPPRFSFAVSDPHYLITFGVMLTVAIIIANLVSAVRQQTVAAAARERRTATLYAMSRELTVTRDAETMLSVAERHIGEVSHGSALVLVRDERGQLRPRRATGKPVPDLAIGQWVEEHQQRAGLGSQYFPAEGCMYLPLIGSQDLRGVLIVKPSEPRRALLPEQSRLLEALTSQLALALERARLVEVAQAAKLAAERAALRNTLLASISHDLRTPLSVIAGAGSMMAHESFPLDAHRRTTLGRLIEDKARDMTELLSNVLELMRLETGAVGVTRDWHLLEDLIGLTLRQNEGRLASWRVRVDVPADFPLLFVEGSLIVQVLSNLVENCTKYTPEGTTIKIAARVAGNDAVINVEDNGPGFATVDPERLFDKFERGRTESNVPGVGLGLAICRAVARLHGGDISAVRVESGGARFEIRLPLKPLPDEPPANQT